MSELLLFPYECAAITCINHAPEEPVHVKAEDMLQIAKSYRALLEERDRLREALERIATIEPDCGVYCPCREFARTALAARKR